MIDRSSASTFLSKEPARQRAGDGYLKCSGCGVEWVSRPAYERHTQKCKQTSPALSREEQPVPRRLEQWEIEDRQPRPCPYCQQMQRTAGWLNWHLQHGKCPSNNPKFRPTQWPAGQRPAVGKGGSIYEDDLMAEAMAQHRARLDANK